LGKELVDTDIRVNAVAPAACDTDMIRQFSPEAIAAMVSRTALRRLGTAEEVAELVLWLCSDSCTFNTGAVFDLSGGRAAYSMAAPNRQRPTGLGLLTHSGPPQSRESSARQAVALLLVTRLVASALEP